MSLDKISPENITLENKAQLNIERGNPELAQLTENQPNASDSLLGCLLLACRTHQVTTTKDALIAGLPLRDGKMTPALFKRAAERANLAVTTLKKPLNQIRTEFLPVILLLKDDEACMLTGVDENTKTASVIYPELGLSLIHI